MSLTVRPLLTLLATLGLHLPMAAQQPASTAQVGAADLSSLVWRELGPAVTSGRITSFAVDPRDERVIYAASASGGLWKTTNAGTEWRPIFEHQQTASMGVVALAPSNPDIVCVGTGEQNSIRSSSFGDGHEWLRSTRSRRSGVRRPGWSRGGCSVGGRAAQASPSGNPIAWGASYRV